MQNIPNSSTALTEPTTHAKQGSGELSLLMAMISLQTMTDQIQAAIASYNIYVSSTTIPAMTTANQAVLDADQAAEQTYANGGHQDDADYAQCMFDFATAYQNDNKNGKTAIDMTTTKATMLSDTVTTISKDTSAASTMMQSALNVTSNTLDLMSALA